MIVVSSCLAGIPCRYDGKSVPVGNCVAMVKKGEAVAACPEVMGGLESPRDPCEIVGGDGYDVLAGRARIVDKAGRDRTAAFVSGAQKFLEFLQIKGADMVYLKAKSPSCGLGAIYDGTFSGTLKEGDGVTAALLKMNGIKIRVI
jgi:uncharacterized protein YbbK (DUF523 family)